MFVVDSLCLVHGKKVLKRQKVYFAQIQLHHILRGWCSVQLS